LRGTTGHDTGSRILSQYDFSVSGPCYVGCQVPVNVEGISAFLSFVGRCIGSRKVRAEVT
jgi:hypothetical protein